MMGRGASRAVRIVVSAVMLVGIIFWVGPAQLLRSITSMDVGWFLASWAMAYVTIFLGGVNVYILTRAIAPELHFSQVLPAYVRSWAAGMIAPGKLGDLTYSHFLTAHGVSHGPGLAVVVVDKVITLMVITVIACIGLVAYASVYDAALAGVLALVLIGTGLVALLNPRLRLWVRTRVLRRYAPRFSGFSGHVSDLFLRHPRMMVLNLAVTVLRIVAMAIVGLFGLFAFGADVGVLDVVVVNSIGQLTTLIPFTLSGIGVRQGVSIVLYDRIAGVDSAAVLNQSLLAMMVSYVNVALVFAVLGAREGATAAEATGADTEGSDAR